MNMKMHIWDVLCGVIYNIEKLELNQGVQKRVEEIRACTRGFMAPLWMGQAIWERLPQYCQGSELKRRFK